MTWILAYGSVPHDTGTFTFYRNLRAGLRPYGWDVRCVSIGAQERRVWDPSFADEGCVLLAGDQTDRKRQAQAFVEWCDAEGVDVVMPINSVAILSAIPHLPESVRVVSRCANAFDHGYRITISGEDRLAKIVATTPRHIHDLTQRYGVREDRLTLIPHGIDAAPYDDPRPPKTGEALRIAFLGRLEHNQKGVLFIPDIVEALRTRGTRFHLTIAGEGVHRAEMEAAMNGAIQSEEVQFVGRLAPSEVPAFLAVHDVLLFPSQFEGFGFVLIEAMMAGTVPVASRLDQITDFIVEDGESGYVCPVGDVRCFSERLAALQEDGTLLARLQRQAASSARSRFSQSRMATDYASLFGAVVSQEPHGLPPVAWSAFRVDPAFRPRWRRFVPRPLRAVARRLLRKIR